MFKKPSRASRRASLRLRSKRHVGSLGSRRLSIEALEPRQMLAAGTWSPLVNAAPNNIGTMELLSDGTVMAQAGGSNAWYKLTPDAAGSYVNGTWSQLANMNLGRLYYATNVLRDGRVFVLGGEYSGPSLTANWTNAAEIYDPVANTWTVIPSYPESGFGDSPSMILPDGRVIAGSGNNPNTNIYDPATNTWSPGPTKLFSDRS